MFDLRAWAAGVVVCVSGAVHAGPLTYVAAYPLVADMYPNLYARFGWSVGNAGDVNNDGINDVIVGADMDETFGAGAGSAYVFCGATGKVLHRFYGDASDAFGYAVGGAGDVNNDGHDDVIVGAPLNTMNGPNAGMVRVFCGATGSVLHTFYGDAPGQQFGFSVAGAGDVNNDGHDDVIIGMPNTNPGIARVYCGATGNVIHSFVGDAPGSNGVTDWFGFSVSGAGDVNGDGHADVIVGAPRSEVNGLASGMVRVYCGATGDVIYTFVGDHAGNWLGRRVARGGDVNNDGVEDLMAASAVGWEYTAGMARVYCGATGGVLHTFFGDHEGDLFGASISGLGDVNGDGYGDVIVGAHFADAAGPDFGLARVFCGRTGGEIKTFYGDQEESLFGVSVAGLGDVNGDGRGDFVVGAALQEVGLLGPVGMARVYLSVPLECADGATCDGDADRSGLVDLDDVTFVVLRLGTVCPPAADSAVVSHAPVYPWNGVGAGAQFGVSVSGAGDVNNDGYADVIVGAPFDATISPGGGSADVYCGATGVLIHRRFSQSTGAAWFGFSVSGAGDVNGNGHSDVVIGAPQHSGVGAGSGFARIVRGDIGSTFRTYFGENAGDTLGYSVSGAGDVNNDGFDDVIVGAPGADPNGAGSGYARVYCSASGAVLHTFDGAAAGDRMGHSVGGAGDVNGDGHADLVVGAPFHDANGSNSGAVYVLCGATGATLFTFLGDQAEDRLGSSVGGAGDVNGDGVGDVIAGAPMGVPGYARVYCGATGAVLATFVSGLSGDDFGGSVSGAGDVNGDGYADLIVGASRSNVTASLAGSVYVYCGATSAMLYAWHGNSIGDRFGFSVSGVGDVNGDGFDDLIAGSHLEDNNGSNSGSARVFMSVPASCPPVSSCDGDADGSGIVTIDDLTFVVLRLGNMCPEVCP